MARFNFPVPDNVHGDVKAAAAYAGVSMQAWVTRVCEAEARRQLDERERERRRRGPAG